MTRGRRPSHGMDGREADTRDARLRRRLGPDPRTVDRVVRGALEAAPGRRRPGLGLGPGFRWAAAAVILVGLAILLVVRGAPAPGPASLPAPGPAHLEPRVSMLNVGEVVVVRRSGGGGHLVRSEGLAGSAEEPAGPSRMIIRQGGTR